MRHLCPARPRFARSISAYILFIGLVGIAALLLGEALGVKFAQGRRAREAPRRTAPARRPAPANRPAMQQINADGSITGQVWVGENAVQRTTIEIMNRERARGARPARIREREPQPEPVRPNRERLPQNPNALPGTQWPPAPEKISETGEPPAPRAAQVTPTPTLSFNAASLSDTGAFPPDTMGAVGPSQFLVAVNGRIRVFDKKTGERGALDADIDVFFDSVRGGQITTDPRVRYDRLSGRWYVLIINIASNNNRVMLAVSDGAQITAGTVWSFFFFAQNEVAPVGDSGCFADYPSLGIDAHALYIGVNMFCGSSFSNTTAFIIRKSSLLGAGPIVASAFRNLIDGNPLTGANWIFTPQGVDNYAANPSEGYLIGTDANSFGRLVMRRVTNPGGTPVLSPNIYINTLATSNPITVRHRANSNGANGRLDGLDDRLFAAHLRNGSIWTAHNISVDNTGSVEGTRTRNASRWYEITGLTGAAPTIAQAGTLFEATEDNSVDNLNYWIPALMVSGQGHALMGFSVAGTNAFVDAGIAMRYAGDPAGTMQDPVKITNSPGPYNPPSNSGNSSGRRRWGDYSYTSLDPCDDMTMWTIQEFCDAINSYGLQVVRIPAPPPAAPVGANPPAVAAGQASVNVTITGISTNNSGFYDPGSGFGCRLQAAVSGGVTVNSVSYLNPTTIVLNLSTVNAANGLKSVTITNPDGQAVTGTNLLTVGACSYTAAAASQSFTAAGGTGTINVGTTAACGWTAYSGSSFITINSGGAGSGNGAVSFTVAPTQGPARTGTVMVAGQPITISQSAGAGCAYVLTPPNRSFTSTGGSGSIKVAAAPECSWTATSSEPFVTIITGGSGSGNGGFSYSVAENKGAAMRTATITVGNQNFTVTQEPAPLELAIDDGTFETSTGLAAGGNTWRVNRLTPSFYPATMNGVAIFFKEDSGVKVGDPVTILVGKNPDGDANIDATQFQTVTTTVQALGQFNVFSIPETTITQGDFVAGLRITHAAGVLPVSFDLTPPSRARSYRSTDGNAFVLTEALGTAGNYGIRARLVRPDKLVVNAGAQLAVETCAPANKAIDPGETVTVSLSLRNDGARSTQNLVATLESNGVVPPANSNDLVQSYGAIAPGAAAVARNFTFTTTAACGGVLDLTLRLRDGNDELSAVVFKFTVGAQAKTSQTVSYTGPAAPIPDGSSTGVSVPINVSGLPAAIADLNFRIDGTQCTSLETSTTVGVTHPWVGDLAFRLTSPAGTTVTIINRAGGGGNSGNNFCQTLLDDEAGSQTSISNASPTNAPYLGSYFPSSPLSAFDGENPNGTWTLTVIDEFAGDAGVLRAFSLIVTGYECCSTGCLDVTGAAPSSGPVGTSVVITGSGFQGVTAVRFGNVPATFKINSNTEIVATVPAGATTGGFVLSKPGCVDARTLNFGVYPTIALAPDAPAVPAGQSGPLTVNINIPQSAATTVALSSSNTSSLLVPASVTIAAGATSATFQATGQAAGSAVVTARLPTLLGGGSATRTVTVVPRLLTIVNAAGALGRTVSVPIELDSKGDENAISFSLTFDPAVLANPQALPGADAANAQLGSNANQAQQGLFGLTITLPAGQKFATGARRIANVVFDVLSLPTTAATSVGFGDQPVARSTLNTNGTPLSSQYADGAIRIGQGYEADVSPRPAGNNNGRLTVTDWTQMGRFVAGLDAPAAGTEFQRADSAPRQSLGDGKIDLADFVQTGRYVSGEDAPQPGGGPTAPTTQLQTPAALASEPALRRPAAAIRNQATVAVSLDAQGDEQAASFTVEFDPAEWQYVAAEPGGDAPGAQIIVNSRLYAQGRIGIVIALPQSRRIAPGARELVLLHFAPLHTGSPGRIETRFGNAPVSSSVVDRDARVVSTTLEIRQIERPRQTRSRRGVLRQ
ncbi:MAG: proprotein convertase P-domain-containing protein [Blastocatellia bacterium]|nr:proprotein convertase P-domain-containing protein [Blastocatellia bacterium]